MNLTTTDPTVNPHPGGRGCIRKAAYSRRIQGRSLVIVLRVAGTLVSFEMLICSPTIMRPSVSF